MVKKILHICERSTFIEDVINNYELVFQGKNVFLINTDKSIPFNEKGNLPEKDGLVILEDYKSISYQKVVDGFEEKYFLVIFHNVGHHYKRKLAKLMHKKVHMHAILWGWEIYEDPKFKSVFYKYQTLKYLNSTKQSKDEIILNIKAWFNGNIHIKTMRRMTSISTILKSEYTFLKEEYNIDAPYFPHNYSKIANVFNERKENISGINILIGNSATPPNNHLDIIQFVPDTLLLEESKLFLPMSYGSGTYFKLVESSFRKYYGQKVNFLKEFVPLDEYNSLINSCGFVIMNHIRQQGLGNIYLSLWNGAKVFLDESSFAYKELINDGIKVYKLKDFLFEYPKQESENIILRNRQLILKSRGKETTLKYISELVNQYLIE